MGSEFLGVGSESESFLRLVNTGVRFWRMKGGRSRRVVSAETYPEPWVGVMRVWAEAEAGFDRVMIGWQNRLLTATCQSCGCEGLLLG